jgi:hypothetical protein
MSDIKEDEIDIKTYKTSPEQVMAVEVFQSLREFIIEKHGAVSIASAHLAACLLEEAANRAMPAGSRGDILILAAKIIAPTILDEVIADVALDSQEEGGIPTFNVPGNDEVH